MDDYAAVRRPSLSAPAVLAAATVCATALDTAGRLTSALPLTIYQIVLVCGLVSAGWALLSGKLIWRRTPLDLPLAVFVVAVGAGTLAGLQFGVDAFMLAKIASSILLFVLISQTVRTRRERDLVVAALLATVGLSAAYALVARFTGISVGLVYSGVARTSGTFDDPNIFGTVLVLGLVVGAALWMDDPGWRRPWILALAPMALGALVFTFSRGAALGGAVAAAVILVGARRSIGSKVAIVVTAAVVAFILFTVVIPPQFISTKIAGADVDPSAVGRVYMWRSSVTMAQAYPLGIGPGGFPKVYPRFRLQGAASGLVESHNAYLTLVDELGLFGLVAMLWIGWRFSAVTFRTIRRGAVADRALALGAFAAFVAIAVQATTYSLEYSKPLWITLALGVLACARDLSESERLSATRSEDEVTDGNE